jgi:cytochrome P450
MSAHPRRLIMVATSSWRWPPGHRTCTDHEQALTALLDPDLAGRADFCAAAPAARHLALRTPDLDRDGHAVVDLDPGTWSRGDPAPLTDLVRDLRQLCFEHLRTPGVDRASGLGSLRHRVHMDRERVVALFEGQRDEDRSPLGDGDPDTDGDPDARGDARRAERCRRFEARLDALAAGAPFDAGLDVRFRYVQNQLTCRLSVSVWSHAPRSAHHRPPGWPGTGAPDEVEPESFRDTATAVHAGVVDWFTARGFVQETLRVFDRPYLAPVFTVAVPPPVGTGEAAAMFTEDEGLLVPGLVGPFLRAGDARERGTAVSVLDGELLALRRFVADGGTDVPHYLLLPGAPRPGGADPLVEQEDRIRWAVTFLTDLETDAADELWDAQSELEIWDNHLQVYQRTVDRGTTLWDGLAGHLLQHRGPTLDRTHQAVELVHQTMLQGVADVDKVSTLVDAARSRIPRASETLAEVYDREVTELTPPGRLGLLRAITREGHFAAAGGRAEEIALRATRVARSYRDLVQAISDAFDERRVRETDTVQRTTFGVGLILGTVGLVTVLDTTFELQLASGPPQPPLPVPLLGVPLPDLFRAFVWALGLVLVGGLVWGLVRSLRLGRLGSWAYQRAYTVVWDTLRLCSTDHLLTVARRIEPPEEVLPVDDVLGLETLEAAADRLRGERARVWAQLDDRLSRRWAAAWDLVSDLPGDVRQPPQYQLPRLPAHRGLRGWWTRRRARRIARDDLRRMSAMVEKWSLRAFLITERPLRMWQSTLPRLTLLYRCAFQLLQQQDVRAVSAMDLYFLFEKRDLGLDWDEVGLLDAWLDRTLEALRAPATPDGVPGRVRATDLLAEIAALGIDAATGLRTPPRTPPRTSRGTPHDPAGPPDRARLVARLGGRAPVREDLDPWSPSGPEGPYGVRSAEPVVYAPAIDRWVVSDRHAVEHVLTDTGAFSPVDARRPWTPLVGDDAHDPDHRRGGGPGGDGAARRRHRRRTERLLAGRSARRATRELGRRLPGELSGARRGDRVELMGVLRPALVRAALRTARLPASDDDVRATLDLAAAARRLHGHELDGDGQRRAAEGMRDLRRRCRDAARRRRAGGAGSADERAERLVQLLMAGPEVTAAVLGNGFWHLLRTGTWHDIAGRGAGRDRVLRAAVEECLRIATPVVVRSREATRAATVPTGADGRAPVVVPAGARLLVHIGAANRDPAFAGPEPDVFDPVGRAAGRDRHVSFGAGEHACPAAELVREQCLCVLRVLAELFPGAELDDREQVPDFLPDRTLRALPELWVGLPAAP